MARHVDTEKFDKLTPSERTGACKDGCGQMAASCRCNTGAPPVSPLKRPTRAATFLRKP